MMLNKTVLLVILTTMGYRSGFKKFIMSVMKSLLLLRPIGNHCGLSVAMDSTYQTSNGAGRLEQSHMHGHNLFNAHLGLFLAGMASAE